MKGFAEAAMYVPHFVFTANLEASKKPNWPIPQQLTKLRIRQDLFNVGLLRDTATPKGKLLSFRLDWVFSIIFR